jgi:Mrp family chromosome partitioning ATPase
MRALQTANALVVHTPASAVRVQPRPVRNALLGIGVGLVVGLLLANLAEVVDPRVRSVEELESQLGLALLGQLPAPPKRLASKSQLVTRDPAEPTAESFRLLRANLDFANLTRRARTIMVVSAAPREGKSTTAANLAVALALGGRRVVLVDFDLRNPSLARLLDAQATCGLSDVVLGECSLEQALVPIELSGPFTTAPRERASAENGHEPGGTHRLPISRGGTLELLLTGRIPPSPGDFAGAPEVGELLGSLGGRADVVLLDTPPVLSAGEAVALSGRVDGLVAVARLGLVTRPMVRDFKRVLDAMPASKLGMVITGVKASYGYGYGYGTGGGGSRRDPLVAGAPAPD